MIHADFIHKCQSNLPFWKCCGISNKRDGTDDWIFDYERLKQVKSNDEVEILNGENDEGNNINGDHYDKEEERLW